MKVSVQWLHQYVDLTGITSEKLADMLTLAGLEVEGIEKLSNGTNLVVGQVLSCVNHPDSDHLHVCEVDLGKETVQIVCGAPNVAINQKVIVAKVGAVLPEITIKAARVRNIESNGMICSLFELGVDKKYLSTAQCEGIEVLDNSAVIGDENPLGFLGLDDSILDVKQTPNRSDFMSLWSVAKEVGAILNRPVLYPWKENAAKVGSKTTLKIISKTEKCPYFLGKIINSITVKQSPEWMKQHLLASGIKSINNVVDISNYVMLETGQPLHFYDLAKIPSHEITVIDGQKLTTKALDGIAYEIEENDLLIISDNEAIGVAGIMGGDQSKIDEDTKGIIIESALFDAVCIRNTARRLGLSTEACVRFTKGLDPLSQIKAMDRAVELLIDYADATMLEETVECGKNNYEPVQVVETLTHINTLLGTNFSSEEVMDVLTRLDFNPVMKEDHITMCIPSYRTDILIAQDIDEEVIRMLGYSRLPTTLPNMETVAGTLNPRQKMRRNIRSMMSGFGLSETLTYTLISQKLLDRAVIPLENPISLATPMSEDRKYIRSSILPSMLECLAYNQARKIENVQLFELSYVYGQATMQEHLGIILSGVFQTTRWKKIAIPADFYCLKGMIITMLNKFGFDEKRIYIKENKINTNQFHPYRSACVYIGKELLGIFGQIHPQLAKSCDVDACMMAELNIDVLADAKAAKLKFIPLPKYPSIVRDIALVVEENLNAEEILNVIKKTGKEMIKNIEVFDVYQGEHVEVGKKSIALSITYYATDKTLTDQEVNEVHMVILSALASQINAVLR